MALVEYHERLGRSHPDKKPQIPNFIGLCIMKIATNLATKWNFAGYSFIQEMSLDAMEKMVESVDKYDCAYKNPLGYFTQVAWNCFLQRIEKEEKQQYIKHKNFQKMAEEMEAIVNSGEVDFDNENHNKVLEKFERPKVKNTSAGYKPHANLSYEKNRRKKVLTSEEDKPIIEETKKG